MENDPTIFIEEENIISLRRAYVMEMDGIINLSLTQESSSFVQRPKIHSAEFQDWIKTHSAFLYQQVSTNSKTLIWGLKRLKFETLPKFKLLWTDSGNSVAVCLNDEPWAFLDENTQKAYSKGIMADEEMNPWYRDYTKAAKSGNPWHQKQFETTFAGVMNNL